MPTALPFTLCAAAAPSATPSHPLLVQFHHDSAAAPDDDRGDDSAPPMSEAGSSSDSDDEASQEPTARLSTPSSRSKQRDAASRRAAGRAVPTACTHRANSGGAADGPSTICCSDAAAAIGWRVLRHCAAGSCCCYSQCTCKAAGGSSPLPSPCDAANTHCMCMLDRLPSRWRWASCYSRKLAARLLLAPDAMYIQSNAVMQFFCPVLAWLSPAGALWGVPV
jgi:hypothetical protein